jgi:hypothetical protein
MDAEDQLTSASGPMDHLHHSAPLLEVPVDRGVGEPQVLADLLYRPALLYVGVLRCRAAHLWGCSPSA